MAGMIIELRRRSFGKRGASKSDVRVYKTGRAGKHRGLNLGVRVTARVLTECDWKLGDCVVVDFDVVKGVFSMRRTDDKSGNALSAQGKVASGDGTVRFAVDTTHLRLFGLEDVGGYDCSVVSATSDVLTFRRS
jgi:hypothetical protein